MFSRTAGHVVLGGPRRVEEGLHVVLTSLPGPADARERDEHGPTRERAAWCILWVPRAEIARYGDPVMATKGEGVDADGRVMRVEEDLRSPSSARWTCGEYLVDGRLVMVVAPVSDGCRPC